MARRQVGQLHAPATEERVGTNEKRIGPLARESLESRIDLLTVAGVEELNLQPHGASSELHVSQRSLHKGARRFDEHGHARSYASQLTQQFQPFCDQFGVEEIHSGQLAARSRK